jgi:Ca2+-binding EF-hand superfamily protein
MFADFVDFMARKMTDPGLNEEAILDSFSVFDKEKNGIVNAEEVDSIFKDADIDADGNIKYKDFVKKLNDLYEIFT